MKKDVKVVVMVGKITIFKCLYVELKDEGGDKKKTCVLYDNSCEMHSN